MINTDRTRVLLCLFAFLAFQTSAVKNVMSWPDLVETKYLLVDDALVEIKDGMDLSGQWLTNAKINRQLKKLKNVNFERCDLTGADLRETSFENCSFKKANLTDVDAYDASFQDCDFEDAIITGAKEINISKEQLVSTWNFKGGSLADVLFSPANFSGIDFSTFNLSSCDLFNVNLVDCNFTDAHIGADFTLYSKRGAKLDSTFSKNQLITTRDFKMKQMVAISFWGGIDLSDLDLSDFNLTGSLFASTKSNRDFDNTNLANAVITDCDFSRVMNLTLAQIKSTWNYKAGRMEGVKLPKELQAQLDAEKKKKGSEKRDRE